MTRMRMILGLVLALAPAACDDGGSKDAKPEAAKGGDKGKADKAKADKAKDGEAPAKVAEAGAKDAEADAGADAAKGGDEPAEGDVLAQLDKRVQRAVKLAKEIEAKPDDATKILEAADLDREGFEELIYSIGSDPDLSKQYQVAMAGD